MYTSTENYIRNSLDDFCKERSIPYHSCFDNIKVPLFSNLILVEKLRKFGGNFPEQQ